mmetsp:Transcript_19287/g.27136  ORF Transcript_19287/g.27136 Transcript_19287/m.27136 type:complete len:540 (+) Transcript_19287:24-1643(+)
MDSWPSTAEDENNIFDLTAFELVDEYSITNQNFGKVSRETNLFLHDNGHEQEHDSSVLNPVLDENDLTMVMERVGEKSFITKCQFEREEKFGTNVEWKSKHMIHEMTYRRGLIENNMGSMALCRGKNGDILREAGAIRAALSVLYVLMFDDNLDSFITMEENSLRLQGYLPAICIKKDDDKTKSGRCTRLGAAALDLASAAFCALRDLACGNATNRHALNERIFKDQLMAQNRDEQTLILFDIEESLMRGTDLISLYLLRYHHLEWFKIMTLTEFDFIPDSSEHDVIRCGEKNFPSTQRGKKELRLMTSLIGAVRNASHGTRSTCKAFCSKNILYTEDVKVSLADLLIWRILDGSSFRECSSEKDFSHDQLSSCKQPFLILNLLPDTTNPYREACYRCAGSIINLAEKSSCFALKCSKDDRLLLQLVHSWGGIGSIIELAIDKDKNKVIFPIVNNKKNHPKHVVLHPGLIAIMEHRLKYSSSCDTQSKLGTSSEKINFEKGTERTTIDEMVSDILKRESQRKQYAKSRELLRKLKNLTK